MITNIALHIALVDDIEKRQTRMILVLWTDSTVKWAPAFYGSQTTLRQVRLFQIIVAFLVVCEIA